MLNSFDVEIFRDFRSWPELFEQVLSISYFPEIMYN